MFRLMAVIAALVVAEELAEFAYKRTASFRASRSGYAAPWSRPWPRGLTSRSPRTSPRPAPAASTTASSCSSVSRQRSDLTLLLLLLLCALCRSDATMTTILQDITTSFMAFSRAKTYQVTLTSGHFSSHIPSCSESPRKSSTQSHAYSQLTGIHTSTTILTSAKTFPDLFRHGWANLDSLT